MISFIADHLKMCFNDVNICWVLFSNIVKSSKYAEVQHIVAHPYDTPENIQRLWSFQLGK